VFGDFEVVLEGVIDMFGVLSGVFWGVFLGVVDMFRVLSGVFWVFLGVKSGKKGQKTDGEW
jgi:hypothetical protein